jgi:NhaP-type Na+/H+ or K+/H+ antiporter
MDIFAKWFVIDLLKLLSHVGIVIVFFVVVVIIEQVRPVYGFVDILVILAVGMLLGVVYTEVQKWATGHFDKWQKQSESG